MAAGRTTLVLGSAAIAAGLFFGVRQRFPEVASDAPVKSAAPTTAKGTPAPKTTAPEPEADAAEAPPVAPEIAPKADASPEELARELEQLKAKLLDDPHDKDALQRLVSIHALGHFRDDIVSFLKQLYEDGNGAPVLAESIADLFLQENRYDEAAEWLRRSVPYTDTPMRGYYMLAYSEIKTGDYERALDTARAQRQLAADYLTGKRDGSLIKDEIDDEHVFVPCMMEAIALAKLDDLAAAREALSTCGEGLVSDEARTEFQASVGESLEDLRDKDVDEILD